MTSIFKGLLPKGKTVLSTENRLTTLVRYNHDLNRPTHKVNNLEKRFLVWTGKYKSVDEVPDRVNQNVVERARNRMRIRIANYMMAATIIGCLLMVYSGKRAAQKGESVAKQNLEWHKSMRAE